MSEYDHLHSDLEIPDSLKVPVGHNLFLHTYGKGSQIYTCPDRVNPTPFAILYKDDWAERELFAIHYGGPIWEAYDGSVFVGDVARQKTTASPNANSVPWLLTPSKSTMGGGLMSKITYIQRLWTRGGQVTSPDCIGRSSGEQFLIAYAAQYLFYTASD